MMERSTSEAWRRGPPVMIFPEGVLTNGSALIQFRAGAFDAARPVTPVCLRHRWRNFNPSGTGANRSMATVLLRTMCQFSNSCDIDILDEMAPTEAEHDEPILFAQRVRKAMAAHLQLPCTEH